MIEVQDDVLQHGLVGDETLNSKCCFTPTYDTSTPRKHMTLSKASLCSSGCVHSPPVYATRPKYCSYNANVWSSGYYSDYSSGYYSNATTRLSSVEENSRGEIWPYDYFDLDRASIRNLSARGLVAKKHIQSGQFLGEYTGMRFDIDQIYTNSISRYGWELHYYSRLVCVIDGICDATNWLKHISPAKNMDEQNILVIPDTSGRKLLFYTAFRIQQGSELLAWYLTPYHPYYFFQLWNNFCPEYAFIQQSRSLFSMKRKELNAGAGNSNEHPKILSEKENLSKTGADEGKTKKSDKKSEEEANEEGAIPALSGPESNPLTVKPMGESRGQQETDILLIYQCFKCKKRFKGLETLEKHQKYTKCGGSKKRNYICTICGRAFDDNSRLKVHINHVHHKIKNHQCNVCGKRFSQSSSLTKHYRRHTGEKPYKCSYCHEQFTSPSILNTHIRQHTGEKPFICHVCYRSFASHAAHNNHVWSTHRMKPNSEEYLTYEVLPHQNINIKIL